MNWVPVKSRMLAAVAYNDNWQQLYLRFRSGDIYCYRGVPAAVHCTVTASLPEAAGWISTSRSGDSIPDQIQNVVPTARYYSSPFAPLAVGHLPGSRLGIIKKGSQVFPTVAPIVGSSGEPRSEAAVQELRAAHHTISKM